MWWVVCQIPRLNSTCGTIFSQEKPDVLESEISELPEPSTSTPRTHTHPTSGPHKSPTHRPASQGIRHDALRPGDPDGGGARSRVRRGHGFPHRKPPWGVDLPPPISKEVVKKTPDRGAQPQGPRHGGMHPARRPHPAHGRGLERTPPAVVYFQGLMFLGAL